jgi:hypothetical protein
LRRNIGRFGPFATFRIAENCPRSAANLLACDEAFLLAVNIAKLPSVPRGQVLAGKPKYTTKWNSRVVSYYNTGLP